MVAKPPPIAASECPHCQVVHTPADLLRLDPERLQCKSCTASQTMAHRRQSSGTRKLVVGWMDRAPENLTGAPVSRWPIRLLQSPWEALAGPPRRHAEEKVIGMPGLDGSGEGWFPVSSGIYFVN